ncbi:MAG: SPOR domain-containing protein [Candidatus Endonucleobacter sp. (ex Gigantidas childressi)]|nr:SPOR domain-containing protein [Candidatus Endonucleobacter sp. (ex Gigantidas childressi)]
MRWLTMLLIVVNMAFFAWGTFHVSRLEDEKVGVGEDSSLVQGASIKFTSEVGVQSASANKKNHSFADQKEQSDYCLLVGPFSSSDEVKEIQKRFRSLGAESRESYTGASPHSDYWVYLRPKPNHDEAIGVLKKLQVQGVSGSVIASGELENGIFLGVFSRRSDAEDMVHHFSGVGYAPAIKVLNEKPASWWLELNQRDANLLGDEVWEDISYRTNEVKINKIEKRCKDVASDNSFL